MVSPLWNAASEGNMDILLDLLPNASLADIEIKGLSSPQFFHYLIFIIVLPPIPYRPHWCYAPPGSG